jgi:hypothetical protein
MFSQFKKELKKQARMALTAAIGFIIAFSWRDYIMSLTSTWLSGYKYLAGDIALFSAVFLTFTGVFLILISSKLLEGK